MNTPPRVLRKSLLAGAREAKGVAVVIFCLQRDLFRFALVACQQSELLVARRVEVPHTEVA